MDGEADEFEIRRVLNEAADDPELRGVWERYHLVRSVMRGEMYARRRSVEQTVLDANRCGREHRRRQRRTDRSSSRRGVGELGPARRRRGRRGCGCGGDLGYRTDECKDTPAQVAVVEQAVPRAAAALFDDEMRLQSVPAALDLQRAHAYMLHHAHHVALNNRSVVPFVKVAAFESTK
jgi:hypothetical protein